MFEPVKLLSEPELADLSGRKSVPNPRIVIDTNGVELGGSAAAITREIQHVRCVAFRDGKEIEGILGSRKSVHD